MSNTNPEEDNSTPEPFFHQSENFSSAYFGEVPEHIRPAAPGNNKQLMANIISLLSDPRNRELREDALNLLRENNAADLLVTMIGMKEYAKNRLELLTACWESGLDFSAHLVFFTSLSLEKNIPDEQLLEILTIINEMRGPFTDEIVEKAASDLQNLPQNHPLYPIISATHRKLYGPD
jgi:hypothetical protein